MVRQKLIVIYKYFFTKNFGIILAICGNEDT